MILWNPSSALFLGLGLGNLALQAEATLRASSQEHRELHKKKKKYSKASPWPDLPDIIVPTPGDGNDGGDEDCATRANDTPEKIMECIELEALREHHRVWQGYADDGDGTRYWNTLACDQTAFYIGNMLEAYGYNVTYQLFGQSQYQEDPEKPAIVYSVALDKYFENAKIPELGDDFATYLYLYSGSGKIQAPIQAIGYIDPDTLGDGESESGCTVEQFEAEGFVPGNIAMLQRGTCSTETKAENAEAAGASAVIIFNEGTPGRENLRAVSGLDLVPYLVHIPVIGASHHMAAELIAVEGTEVYLEVNGVTFPGRTFNVIAETYGGDPENVLVLGGHMDSEILGAGINDDASGLTALLEVAKQAANIEPLNKLRFCFWAAEEIGLVGSTHYGQSLTEEEIASIFLYINADMIASPNYALYIETLDGEGGDGPFEIVTEYYEKYGIPWERGFGGYVLRLSDTWLTLSLR